MFYLNSVSYCVTHIRKHPPAVGVEVEVDVRIGGVGVRRRPLSMPGYLQHKQILLMAEYNSQMTL